MPGPVSRTETWNEPLFASALMATSPVRLTAFAATRRLGICALRLRVLASLLLALERRLIALPNAQDKAL
jgi:hypothetical protein